VVGLLVGDGVCLLPFIALVQFCTLIVKYLFAQWGVTWSRPIARTGAPSAVQLAVLPFCPCLEPCAANQNFQFSVE
jgi:hypothetical protein